MSKKNDPTTTPQIRNSAINQPQLELVTPIEDILDSPSITTPGGTRVRRQVTPLTVDNSFTSLCSMFETEISRQKDKDPGNKQLLSLLRNALKQSRQLQNDVKRTIKNNKTTRNAKNSGFMKESAISEELRSFLKLSSETLSRVECTKLLHKYILAHSLQNPENRREIFPDKALTKLLKYDKRTIEMGGHGPMYYYTLQKLIQQHFV
jgi:chromatin remodeling complex protein RSC6